jgi:hypothetical protein
MFKYTGYYLFTYLLVFWEGGFPRVFLGDHPSTAQKERTLQKVKANQNLPTNTMAESSKPRPSHDQVLSILDDLDSFAAVPTTTTNAANLTKNLKIQPSGTGSTKNSNNAAGNPGDAQSVLDFIDEITQRSSTPTASIATKKLSSSRPVSRKPSSSSIGRRSMESRPPEPEQAAQAGSSPTSSSAAAAAAAAAPSSSSWGWGSVLKHATSSVLSQAKSAAGQVQSVVSDPAKSSEIVKSFNSNLHTQLSGQSEAAKKWKEGVMGYVKASGIDQLGESSSLHLFSFFFLSFLFALLADASFFFCPASLLYQARICRPPGSSR